MEEFFNAKSDKPVDLNYLVSLAKEAVDISESVSQLASALKEAERHQRDLLDRRIPEAMIEIEMDSFTLPSGTEISIGDKISGSLPKSIDERESAIDYLRKNDGGPLIKTKVMFDLHQEDHERLPDIIDFADRFDFDFEQFDDVNHMTLKKYARERLEGGEDIDFKRLGLYHRKSAKVSRPK